MQLNCINMTITISPLIPPKSNFSAQREKSPLALGDFVSISLPGRIILTHVGKILSLQCQDKDYSFSIDLWSHVSPAVR